MTIRRFAPRQIIPADRLNQLVDAANDFRAGQLPRQIQPGAEGPVDESREEVDEEWREVARTTTTVRVSNPEDADQYVDVERAESVTLLLPDGRRVGLILDNSGG